MIDISLNGEPRSLAATQTVADLVEELGLTQKTIAVAINRQIVPRPQWAERSLQAQDQVDVVRAIGGG